MKWIIWLLVVFFSFQNAFAQLENNNWFIGSHVCVGFNNNQTFPFAFPCKGHSDIEAYSAISDEDGNLIFYTAFPDNTTIKPYVLYDKYGNIIENSDSLFIGASATNGVTAIKSKNSIFIFYLYYDFYDPDVKYLSLLSSIYYETKIKNKNTVIKNEKMIEKLFSIKHGNGADWWVITHLHGNNSFVKYLIQNDSILYEGLDSVGSVFTAVENSSNVGEVSINSNGSKFAMVDSDGTINIFSFDRCSGKISLEADLSYLKNQLNFRGVYGCALSNDGSKLYISPVDQALINLNHLYQINLEDSTVYLLDTICYGCRFTQMEMGLDKRLYIGIFLSDTLKNYLAVVEQPDSLGSKCNYRQKGVFLNRNSQDFSSGTYGLPNQPCYAPPLIGANLSAGRDTTILPGATIQIGRSAQPNMIYRWESAPPDPTMSCVDCPQPTVSPDTNTSYYLTLTDTTLPRGDACSFGLHKVRVRIKQPETIKTAPAEQLFKLYPNPTQNNFTIANSESATVEILNLIGQTVYKTELKNAGETQISTENWPNGAYLCRFATDTGRAFLKLSVLR